MHGEAVQAYGKAPGTGDYARHFDRVLGFKDAKERFYRVNTIGQPRRAPDRTHIDVSMRPPHLALKSEVEKNPGMWLQLQEMIDSSRMPPAYFEHPVVVANPGKLALLVSIYMDGVSYSNVDTCVGVWLQNSVTNQRHLLTLVRKSICCLCHCRGWCTWHPLLSALRWDLLALVRGVSPGCRHDGTCFGANDYELNDNMNQPLGVVDTLQFTR